MFSFTITEAQNHYGLFLVLGVALYFGFLIYNLIKYKMPAYEVAIVSIMLFFGIFAGANILSAIQQHKWMFWTAGFSSYGAFIGIVIMTFLFCKLTKRKVEPLIYLTCIPIPLTYAIAKLGCFSAGCCYGIPYRGIFSVYYPDNQHLNARFDDIITIAPVEEIRLFPVQLAETVCFLILFAIVFAVFVRREFKRSDFLLMISAAAFIKGALYYFRFESIGHPFGSHQVICLAVILASLSVMITSKIKNDKKHSTLTE